MPGWKSATPTPAASCTASLRLVVPDFDQVLAGVEEVEILAHSLCASCDFADRLAGLVAGTAHISYRVKVISIFDSGIFDSAEDFVELIARDRERKMLTALGAPLSDL